MVSCATGPREPRTMADLIPVDACLHEAIDAMEGLAFAVDYRRSGAHLRHLTPCTTAKARAGLVNIVRGTRRAEFDLLARLVWQSAIVHENQTLWCLRRTSPAVALAYVICRQAAVPVACLLNGDVAEPQLQRMVQMVAKLAGASLRLSEVGSSAALEDVLDSARLHDTVAAVICNWPLDHEEAAIVRRSGLRFIAPASVTRGLDRSSSAS